jgi:HSP20 family molecular chaperone IbpA
MAESEKKSLQPKEKAEVATPAEQLKTGPVFSPAIDIFETEKEIVLLADMPGVKASDLSIDLEP